MEPRRSKVAVYCTAVIANLATPLSDMQMTQEQCLFQASFFFGGGAIPPKKELTVSPTQTTTKLCALYFFRRDNELQIYLGNFILMDNKRRKLFIIKQSNGANLYLKCTKARIRPTANPQTTTLEWTDSLSTQKYPSWLTYPPPPQRPSELDGPAPISGTPSG